MTTTICEMRIRDLDKVSGGMFLPNTHKKRTYHIFGISTSYHFFARDEFMMMGRRITIDQADDIVRIGNMVKDAINTGQSGNDVIGFTENAFIRAFNSQLKLKYGIVWDWVSGKDF